jgi:hypothetical protein
MKKLTGIYIALAMVAGSAAVVSAAEPDNATKAATGPSCPSGLVSIYFPESQSSPSRETEELLARVGQMAAECRPARVDIVARLDPDEGDKAVSLALDRLSTVSRELTSHGLPALSIRLGTEDVSRSTGSRMHSRQVDILFRQSIPAGVEETAPPAPPPGDYQLPVQV